MTWVYIQDIIMVIYRLTGHQWTTNNEVNNTKFRLITFYLLNYMLLWMVNTLFIILSCYKFDYSSDYVWTRNYPKNMINALESVFCWFCVNWTLTFFLSILFRNQFSFMLGVMELHGYIFLIVSYVQKVCSNKI